MKTIIAALFMLLSVPSFSETVYDWATTVETHDKTHIKITNNQLCTVLFVLKHWPAGTADTIRGIKPFQDTTIVIDSCGEYSVQPLTNCTPNIHHEVGILFFNTCLFTMGVHFKTFDVRRVQDHIEFSWAVENVDNIDYYQIMVSDDDGLTWHPYGTRVDAIFNKYTYKIDFSL